MDEMIARTEPNALEQKMVMSETLRQLGRAADAARAATIFSRYREGLATNTVKRQRTDLTAFARFLTHTDMEAQGIELSAEQAERETQALALALWNRPEAWRVITAGLLDAFGRFQLQHEYAISSTNVRMATLRKYARLAASAEAEIDAAAIATVGNYSKRIDETRAQTRISTEKREPIILPPTVVQAAMRADVHMTPAEQRDALLMALGLELGLRASEMAALTVGDVDMERGQITVYRQKVDKRQRLQLTEACQRVLAVYYPRVQYDDPEAPLLRASVKGGQLTERPLTRITVSRAVRRYGQEAMQAFGISALYSLSAHDLRHTWATRAANAGTPLEVLQQAGGWASLAMPAHYIKEGQIANERVKLA